MALAIETKMAARGNFGSRGNVAVDTIVLHTTEGPTLDSAVSWFADPRAGASAHYVLDGQRVVQCVAEGDCAYHAGNLSVNRRSIGIEVVGHCADRSMWTPEKLALLVTLVADVARRHGIPIVHQPGPGICGHRDVPDPNHPDLRGGAHHHVDPGPYFPGSDFFDALNAEMASAEVA